MPKISDLPSGQSIFSPAVNIVSASTLIQWNLELAQNAVYLATENATLMDPTNMAMRAGKMCILRRVQNDTLAKTMAYDSAYLPSGNLPLFSTALGAVDVMWWYCTGTTMELFNYAQNVNGV